MATILRGQDNFNSGSYGVGDTVNAVGSYSLVGDYSGGSLLPGDTIAGSNLDYMYSVYSFNYASITTSLSGTWRCMGYSGGQYYNNGTAFVRIS